MEWKDIEKDILDKIYNGEKYGAELEGPFIDIKRCPINLKGTIHFCRSMAVCFANANGGTLILGTENRVKGPAAFSGCRDYQIWDIIKGVRDGTHDPINVEVIYHNYKGFNLIEVKIPKGSYEGAHSLSDGSQTVRKGADCLPLYPGARNPKFIQPEIMDYSRSSIEQLEIDDFSKDELKQLKNTIRMNKSSSDFLKMEDEDLLKALGILHENDKGNLKATTAGLLFLGSEENLKTYLPQSEIIFQSIDKNEKIIFEERFHGGLISIVFNLYNFYKKYNTTHDLFTGLVHVTIPKMPDIVLRESVLNALTHREYCLQASIFFKDYPDRIEVINPGAFIGDISPNNILYHIPVWRNRLISEIFQQVGLVNRSGIGIDIMYRELLSSGKEPPQFNEDGSQITLTINDNIDENFAKYLNELERSGKSLPLDEMIILSKFRTKDKLKTKEIALSIQRNEENTKKLLNKMHKERKLERNGVGTGTTYRLSAKMYASLGDALGYFRNGELEKTRYKELIIETLSKNGKITNDDTQKLTGLDRVHSLKLLTELVDEEKIYLIGKGRGAYYQIK